MCMQERLAIKSRQGQSEIKEGILIEGGLAAFFSPENRCRTDLDSLRNSSPDVFASLRVAQQTAPGCPVFDQRSSATECRF